MKAIILAAGVGRRLRAVNRDRPKCLVEVGGRTLLSRHLENLTRLGISSVVLVLGYRRHAIQDAVAATAVPGRITYIVNEQYERGSIGSLWAARDVMDQDVVIMDADVLYHPMILRRLIESPYPTAVLMDETVTQTTEECMVVVREGRIIALTKQVPDDYDFAGEGVGFLKVAEGDIPALVGSLATHIEAGSLDMEYEDALKEFFERVPVGYECIGGLPWIEIDFPEDIDRAEHEVLPAIERVSAHVSLGHSPKLLRTE